MSEKKLSWRAVGPAPDGSGMLALEAWDGEESQMQRMIADVRGGLAWPFPKTVGSETIAEGCVSVVAFKPPKVSGGVWKAQLLRWSRCGTITKKMDENGWPVDPGIGGRIGLAAVDYGCLRYYAFAPADDHDEAMRVLRKSLGLELPGVRVTSFHEGESDSKMARDTIFRWGATECLDVPADAAAQMRTEKSEMGGVGPLSLTLALGAVLRGWEFAPFKARKEAAWMSLPVTNEVG